MVTLDALPLGVPLARLDDEARGRAEAVLGTSLFAHRITGLRARSREPVFLFLLDHPDFAAAVARALKLGRYQVEARDGGYWGDDSRGARGLIRVVYADEGRRLFHLDGMYEARKVPTIQGRMLVLIEFQHEDDPAGGTSVEASVTGHISLDTPLVGTLAQLASTLARPARRAGRRAEGAPVLHDRRPGLTVGSRPAGAVLGRPGRPSRGPAERDSGRVPAGSPGRPTPVVGQRALPPSA